MRAMNTRPASGAAKLGGAKQMEAVLHDSSIRSVGAFAAFEQGN
jgi:hypothetical protein